MVEDFLYLPAGEYTQQQLADLLAIALEPEVPMSLPTRKQLVTSLLSTLCPVCGGKKKSQQTLCRTCYFKLPKPLQQATYAPLGHGYAEAVQDALVFHDVTEPHWPKVEE